MPMNRTLDETGQVQHGLLTPRQLADEGASRQARRTMVRHGFLVPANTRVLRAVGAPASWEQKLLAACLAAGPEAVASHRAAAVLWDLLDPPAPVEITVPYEHHPTPRGTIRHRTQVVREVDRAMRRKIPVTAPARTLVDLGAVAPRQVPEALERCLHQRRLTTAALWRALAELGGRGRRGAGVLRRTLDQRALGDRRPESLLEPLFADIAVNAGITFVYQHPIVVSGRRYRVDFAVPALQLAVEVDGLAVHGTREALEHDLQRQNAIVGLGWMFLRYTYTRLRRDRAGVRREVLAAVAQRRQLLL